MDRTVPHPPMERAALDDADEIAQGKGRGCLRSRPAPSSFACRSGRLAAATLCLASAALCPAHALDDGLVRVPPMGWNSDNYFGDDFPNYCLCDGVVAPKVRPAWLDKFCMCDCKSCPRTGPPHGPNHHYRMTEGAIRAMADVMVSSGMQKA